MEATPGKHSVFSLQNTALFGTLHIMREVLQCDLQPQRLGSPLVQEEKYLGEKFCGKKRNDDGDDDDDDDDDTVGVLIHIIERNLTVLWK